MVSGLVFTIKEDLNRAQSAYIAGGDPPFEHGGPGNGAGLRSPEPGGAGEERDCSAHSSYQ